MYPDAHNGYYCPLAESSNTMVCNQSDADLRFVDKQEYLIWKLAGC